MTAEQEVDVEAALVRLVDDDRVVAAQERVALDLGEQDAVGHDPHERVLARAVAEADRVADRVAERDVELVGDPLGHGARGDAPRLGVADRPAHAATELEADLRQLGRLARPGLARDDDDLVVADRREQVVAAGADRQLLGVGDRGHRRAAPRDARLGPLDLADEARERAGPLVRVRRAAQLVEAPDEPVLVAQRQLAQARAQRRDGRVGALLDRRSLRGLGHHHQR